MYKVYMEMPYPMVCNRSFHYFYTSFSPGNENTSDPSTSVLKSELSFLKSFTLETKRKLRTWN